MFFSLELVYTIAAPSWYAFAVFIGSGKHANALPLAETMDFPIDLAVGEQTLMTMSGFLLVNPNISVALELNYSAENLRHSCLPRLLPKLNFNYPNRSVDAETAATLP